MDLWIRSQDKERLVKIEYIEYFYKKVHYANEEKPREEHHNIGAYISDEQFIVLGKYKTKERALEVLDDIADLIKPKYVIRVDNHEEINNKFLKNKKNDYVSASGVGSVMNVNQTLYYEMPKE